jgi:hypothetical protein
MDEKASTPDTLIEAKLSRIPKAFSIENLIAKKSRPEEIEQQQQQPRIPPIAFPQNFPLYNPWSNYLMSHANLPPQNLLLNSQQLYQLQSDKLGNFADNAPKEMLFDQQPQSLATYQQLQLLHSQAAHQHPDQAHFFTNKLKDATFLNEFYTNYFMLENSRIMNLSINGGGGNNNNNDNCDGSGDNSNISVKRTKSCLALVNNNNDNSNTNSDYDNNVNSLADSHKMMVMMDKSGVYYEDDESYSDLSVTMSPEQQNHQQDKGESGLGICGLLKCGFEGVLFLLISR